MAVNQRDASRGWTPLMRCARMAHYKHAPFLQVNAIQFDGSAAAAAAWAAAAAAWTAAAAAVAAAAGAGAGAGWELEKHLDMQHLVASCCP